MNQGKNNPAETELRRRILESIQRVGWDWQSTNLWFPFVQRETLGLEVNASDGDIHAMIVGLIRDKTLIHVNPEGWRIPNFSPAPDIRGPILPSPGYLGLAYRMPIVREGPIETALENELEIREPSTPSADRGTEKANWAEVELTELEAYILCSIDHVGWYAYLWFSVAAREALNFGSDDCDENVHAAIRSLIERGGLVFRQESVDDNPAGWYPAPGLLKAAERKAAEIIRSGLER
jgi:hypothetical protein